MSISISINSWECASLLTVRFLLNIYMYNTVTLPQIMTVIFISRLFFRLKLVQQLEERAVSCTNYDLKLNTC